MTSLPMTGPAAANARVPGPMTAVMRAFSPTTCTLRVGLLERGRIIDERLMATHVGVTVGVSEVNTFVISGHGLPSTTGLFEARGAVYVLRLLSGMTARLSMDGKVIEVAGPVELALAESARGRVSVGESSILFQFVPLSPAQLRPQLPEGVKLGLGRMDWSMTVIAAFSFLFHFGAVGSLYSDLSDHTIVDDGLAATGFFEHHISPPVVPRVEGPATPETETGAVEPAPPGADPRPSRRTNGGHAEPVAQRASPANDSASLLRAFTRLNAATVAALNPGDSAVSRQLLDPGNTPTSSLDQVARAEVGVSSSPFDMRSATSAPLTPGQSRSLSDLPGREAVVFGGDPREGRPGPSNAPAEADRRPPRATGNRPLTDADRVLAGARARARACFTAGLGVNPDMEGNVSFTLGVSGGGAVTGTQLTSSGTLSPAVTSCVRSVLTALRFEPSESGAPGSVAGSFKFINSSKPR